MVAKSSVSDELSLQVRKSGMRRKRIGMDSIKTWETDGRQKKRWRMNYKVLVPSHST